MNKNMVYHTRGFTPRHTRAIVSALKAKVFRLGTDQHYCIKVVPAPGHERAVALICERVFQKASNEEAKQMLAMLPITPLE